MGNNHIPSMFTNSRLLNGIYYDLKQINGDYSIE